MSKQKPWLSVASMGVNSRTCVQVRNPDFFFSDGGPAADQSRP